MDNRSYNLDGVYFDIIPAEVMYVNYKDNRYDELYSIGVRNIYSVGTGQPNGIISARPFDVSIKKIPLIGEIVYLMRGISSDSSAGISSMESYYLQSPLSVMSNINYNGMVGITQTQIESGNSDSISDPNNGYTSNKSKSNKPSFKLNISEIPLQPFEGDIIHEGRSGNSIRLSSTSIDNKQYTIKQPFGKGISDDGDPILIIRNGNLSKPDRLFNVESIDDPISTIWMTQGQSLKYKNPSDVLSSQDRLGINSYEYENELNSGNQIGLFSDRITIVAKQKEVNVLASNGISLSTNTNISIESGDNIELQSKRINLGIDAQSPVLLGDLSVDLLSNLISELESLCSNITSLTVGTGTGPSTPPINSSAFIANKSKLTGIKGKLETLKSKLVFLNKT